MKKESKTEAGFPVVPEKSSLEKEQGIFGNDLTTCQNRLSHLPTRI